MQNAARHAELYGFVHSQLLRIWRDISTECIQSAWKIPGLEENLYPNIAHQEEEEI